MAGSGMDWTCLAWSSMWQPKTAGAVPDWALGKDPGLPLYACITPAENTQLRCCNSTKASSINSKPQSVSALSCKFRALACSSHSKAAAPAQQQMLTQNHAREAHALTYKGHAANWGLSNQHSAHPPANHPFQQPTRAETPVFPPQCPGPQAEQKEWQRLAPCTRGERQSWGLLSRKIKTWSQIHQRVLGNCLISHRTNYLLLSIVHPALSLAAP